MMFMSLGAPSVRCGRIGYDAVHSALSSDAGLSAPETSSTPPVIFDAGRDVSVSPDGSPTDPHCGTTLMLESTRRYAPAVWLPREAIFASRATFNLPAMVPVITGNGGNHWLKFQIQRGGAWMSCWYQGGSSMSLPADATQSALGMTFHFRSCENAAFDSGCPTVGSMGPGNGTVFGQSMAADRIHFSLCNGASPFGETKVRMSLALAACPDAGTVP